MTAVNAVEKPNFEYGHSGEATAALAAATMLARAVASICSDRYQTSSTAIAAATALPSATAAFGRVSGFPMRR